MIINPVHNKILKHVNETPRNAGESVIKLTKYLTSIASNEYEKARLIFVWICKNIDYDTESYFSSSYKNSRQNSVLKTGKAVCSGYSSLFEEMGQTAGLQVVTINGYAKGYGYTCGEKIKADSTNHAWNAVRIDGKWHLLDSTWGAGHIDDKKKFCRKFQEFYFLTDPKKLIYTHLPAEKKWQLLNKPITLQEFENLPYLKPAFFSSYLDLKYPKNAISKTDHSITYRIGCNRFSQLSSDLIFNNMKFEKQYTFVQKRNNEFQVHVNLPKPGRYILRLYARLIKDKGNSSWAGDFLIISNKHNPNAPVFPVIYGKFNENNVFLHSPLSGILKNHKEYSFQISIPDATEAALIGDDKKWHYLSKKKNDIFSANIKVYGSEMGLYAKFPNKPNFNGLLKYSIK